MWARRWLIFFVFFPKIDRMLLLLLLFRWRTLRWRRQQNGFPMKFASVAGSDMCTSEIICIQNAFCVEGNRIIYTHTHTQFHAYTKRNQVDVLVHCNVPFSETSKIDYAIAKGYILHGLLLFFSVLPRVYGFDRVNFIERSQAMSKHDCKHHHHHRHSQFCVSLILIRRCCTGALALVCLAQEPALLLGHRYFTDKMEHMLM